jgi:hypothetical protein
VLKFQRDLLPTGYNIIPRVEINMEEEPSMRAR